MNAQRVGLTALRRVLKPAVVSPSVARSLVLRSAMATQTRPVSTDRITSDQADTLLAKQRLNRPVSPHLTVYDPAQIWYGASIMQRFTGIFGSGLLYGGSLAYLTAPLVGWHLESASLVALAAGLPVAIKVAAKVALAGPFAFHLFNGVRHLVWDYSVKLFTKAEIAQTTRAIWVASAVSALALALLL